MSLRVVLPALAALTPTAMAWGDLGHQTVAYIAQNFVSDDTAKWAQGILDISNSSYLASVAPWADTFRYSSGGEWSAPFHFIDANDSPPNSCSVDFDRDCGEEGCSVSAIANYVRVFQMLIPHPLSRVLLHSATVALTLSNRPLASRTRVFQRPRRNKRSSYTLESIVFLTSYLKEFYYRS